MNELYFIIDWLTFTIKQEGNFEIIQSICHKLNINYENMFSNKSNINGYDNYLTDGSFEIMWGSKNNITPMGICININGKTCRNLKQYNMTMNELFIKINELRGNVTRLDVAIDDFKGYLNLDTVNLYRKNKWYTSRLRNNSYIEGSKSGSKLVGKTIYFGSPKSNLLLRFYDKRVESGDLSHDIWNRYEIQLRKGHAHSLFLLLLDKGFDIESTHFVKGILSNYINFKDNESKLKNVSERPNAKWWDEFLMEVERIKLYIPPEKTRLEMKLIWVTNTCSFVLKQLSEVVGKKIVLQHLENMIDFTNLKNEHRSLIEECTDFTRINLLNLIDSYKVDGGKYE